MTSCVIFVGLFVLVAGCSEQSGPSTSQTSAPAASTPPVGVAMFGELAGENVTWLPTGSIALRVNVTAGLESLGWGWTTQGYGNQPANGNPIRLTIQMDGCPDGENIGSSGAAAMARWCPSPVAGLHHATISLDAGSLQGRVCVVGIPKGNPSLPGCNHG